MISTERSYSGARLATAIPDLDVAAFTLQRAPELADKAALIDGISGRVLSYRELERSVRGFAAGLRARGFARGDTFAILLPNGPEFAIAFHGVAAAGGRCTTANPLYTAGELTRQLRDAGASMLLTVPPFLAVAREAAQRAGCQLFVVGESGDAAPFSELLGEPDDAPRVAIDPAADVAAILYSSGTTGLPKGVLLSHRNLVGNMVQSRPAFALSREDVVIGVLPFFHCFGLCVVLNHALLAGATLVTMPRFEIETFVDLLERHRVTRAFVVPPIVRALARHPAVERRDLSALRHVLCGASPLDVELAQECARRVGCPVTQGYGMTEMSAATHVVPVAGGADKPGSIGPPIAGTECRLVDLDSGQDAAAGARGELWMRGPQVMRGYLHNPVASAAMIDSDGWLHSGDLAVADADGWFAIVGRVKELIQFKGLQVAPAELEAILQAHPHVADCAVVGVPDEEAGELPKAFVVAAADELDEDALVRFVARQVAPHKRIRIVEVVDEIPRSPAGKILRRVLREREIGV